MRLVLDTNVVVSGLLWEGAPGSLLSAGSRQDIQLFTSLPLLVELTKTLCYPKFGRKITAIGATVDGLVDAYSRFAPVVVPTPLPRVAPDPDDDVVIGTAVAAGAEFAVTGDRTLLSVAEYQGVCIVSVREALVAISQESH